MSTINLQTETTLPLLSFPSEILSPILKYAAEDQGNLEYRLICKQVKDVIDLHVIPYLWKKLQKSAGSITAIDLKAHITQMKAAPSFEISIAAFRALYQKILPKDPFTYIPVVLPQFLTIQAKLLDESLETIWSKIQDRLPNSNGLKSAEEIRSYLNNSANEQALRGITTLVLSSSKLKVIPQEINKFEEVEILYLSDNQLSRAPDLSSLTKLKDLSLFKNQISSAQKLSNLTNLQILILDQNKISSAQELSSLTKLLRLDLPHNKITSYNGLEHLTNLITLYLSHNKITSVKGLSCLTKLETLHLSNNQISSEEHLKLAAILKNTKIEK